MDKLKIKTVIVGELGTNCYLAINEDTKECIIIDPGDQFEKIKEAVASCETVPKAALLTHIHDDHTGALDEVKSEYGIKCYASAKESWNEDFVKVDIPLSGEELNLAGFKIKVLETPGHTAGSVCYYFEDEKVLFSGDTLFFRTYGRTDYETGDFDEIKESLKKLLKLPDDVKAYPGHGFRTSIEYEKTRNAILEDI